MSQNIIGRHRAPSKITLTSIALSRSVKVTAVAATSGGLLAAAAAPTSASPRGVVEDLAAVASDSTTGSIGVDLLSVQLPAVVAPSDRPAVAAVAPKVSPSVDAKSFGTTGFVGVEPPAPEPEPEPVSPTTESTSEGSTAEASPSESSSQESSSSESSSQESSTTESSTTESSTTESSTSERESSSVSRTETREEEPAPEAAPAPTGGVLGVAASYTGIMYSYGGTTPAGFDCSGYTSYVYAQVGVSLPRTAEGQRQATTATSNPQPGDLVFFGSPAYHVGIYAGNGMMYDSGRAGIPTQLRSVFDGVSGYGRVG
ncbi:MAG: C40 family peptidase [Ornithinimicrobium sp.]